MAKIGYARVSSKDQNLARQTNDLKKAGVEKIFTDKQSGKDMQRSGWDELNTYIREGDTLVIKSLDRLSRNYDDIQVTWKDLTSRGVGIQVLDTPLVNVEPNGANSLNSKLFISLLGFVAENEREKIKERQKQGIKIAKSKGVYKGRKREYTANSNNPAKRRIYNEVVKALPAIENKTMTLNHLASELGISRTTVYRIIKQQRINQNSSERS